MVIGEKSDKALIAYHRASDTSDVIHEAGLSFNP